MRVDRRLELEWPVNTMITCADIDLAVRHVTLDGEREEDALERYFYQRGRRVSCLRFSVAG